MKTDKLISSVFIIILVSVLFLHLYTSDKKFSESERRTLQELPSLSISAIVSGSYMDEISTYINDQFIFRNVFRNIEALSEQYIFRKNVINDIVVEDSILYDSFTTLNADMIQQHINNINKIIETLNVKASIMIVPSKVHTLNRSYFVEQQEVIQDIYKKVNAISIDVFPYVSEASDYYKSDPHWTQEASLEIINELFMSETRQYKKVIGTESYLGTLYYKSGLPKQSYEDQINYYTNDVITQVQTTVFTSTTASNTFKSPYKFDGLTTEYDMFLGGNAPIVTLENSDCNGKELIIFRDSFANSFAPLLIQEYSKITLIDLRMVSIQYVYEVLESSNAEVMFLYSLSSLNNDFLLTNN